MSVLAQKLRTFEKSSLWVSVVCGTLQKNIPLGLIHIKSAKSGLFMRSKNSENQKDLF